MTRVQCYGIATFRLQYKNDINPAANNNLWYYTSKKFGE